jgi:hypothetical protein
MSLNLIYKHIKSKEISLTDIPTIYDIEKMSLLIKNYVINNNLFKECLITSINILKNKFKTKELDLDVVQILNPNEYGYFWPPEKKMYILDVCCNYIAYYIYDKTEK